MLYKVSVRLTDDQLYNFCRERYYIDDDEESYPDEKFADLTDDEIQDLISDDIDAIKQLLNLSKGEN